jgi:hypothetical protein
MYYTEMQDGHAFKHAQVAPLNGVKFDWNIFLLPLPANMTLIALNSHLKGERFSFHRTG